MNRREFIAGVGATMAAASAEGQEKVSRVGVLLSLSEDDPQFKIDRQVLLQTLTQLGWEDHRNLTIHFRSAEGNAADYPRCAAELVALRPDVIVAYSPLAVFAVQQQSKAVPIVFISVGDPVGYGLIASMAKPGGNVTGVANFGFAMGGKWIEVLKEIAPQVVRAAFVYHPTTTTKGYEAYLKAVTSAAPAFGITVTEVALSDEGKIQPLIAAFGRKPNGGLIYPPDPFTQVHRDLIVRVAENLRLPAVYPFKHFVESGGLVSYGVDRVEQVQKVANFVSRILHGDKPADLPAEEPTKFELAINLRTAKTLAITVPSTLLARADEVIE